MQSGVRKCGAIFEVAVFNPMQRLLSVPSLFAYLIATTALVACAGGEDLLGTPLEGDVAAAGADGGTTTRPTDTGNGGACTNDPVTVEPLADPSSLPACAPACGGAHCVPTARVPAAAKGALAACSGGLCVPDTLIKSGGAKPKSCKSIGDVDGVCLSVCVPQVAMYKDLLPPADCAADERCAPCVSPLDMKETGACKIGVQTAPTCKPGGGNNGPTMPAGGGDAGAAGGGACPHVGPPVINPTTLPACGAAGSAAHCLSKALVPAAMASLLATCTTGLCVPDKLIASGGNFIPATCVSIGGAEGRCTSKVIPQVAAQSAQLQQATCDASELCAPCFNPLDGKDTGVCKVSCDPGPKGPATSFKDCCVDNNKPRGKCVPIASIPTNLQKNLGDDNQTCTKDAQLCVPTENLAPVFKPATCSATNFLTGTYTGVCLSECLKFGIQGLGISKGNCDDDHRCAPCVNPLDGKPTGAPGCL